MDEGERHEEATPANAGDEPVEDRGDGPDDAELGLERRLERLEEIVSALEADDVELERALSLFEEGIRHVRAAEKALAEAEMKVEELLGEGPDAETRPFDDVPG